MRKNNFIGVCVTLFILISMLSPTRKVAGFLVEEGDSFQFSINSAMISVSVGTEGFDATGIEVGGYNIPQGSFLDLNISTTSNTTSLFRYIAMGHVSDGAIYGHMIESILGSGVIFILEVLNNIQFGEMTSTWIYDNGFNLLYISTFIPYIPMPEDRWDKIDLVWPSLEETFDTDNSTTISGVYARSNRDRVMICEWINEGTFVQRTEEYPIDVSFSNHYMLAIDTQDGVCKGIRFRGSLSGKLNHSDTLIRVSQEFVRVGYSLPAFSITLGIDSRILIVSSILLVTIVIINRKRKKRRN